MLKVYADTGSLDQSRFPDAFPLLMPLLAPQWMNDPAKKANPVWLNQIDITPNPADADAFALVLERQDYFLPNYAAVYQQMADTAIHHKKPLYYFSGGDFGVAPKYAHEIAVRVCAYRPEHESNTVIMPTFFLDPVITILKQEWKPLQKGRLPIVGFCGKATGSTWVHNKELLSVALHNLLRRAGKNKTDRQWMGSASRLRFVILEQLRQSSRVATNYKLFEQYRGGAKTEEQRQASSEMYFQNIMESHYVPCIRGTGNFSARLYETMACGRIPVIIDTAMMLPSISPLSWQDLALVVSPDQIDTLPDLVWQHFNRYSNDAFLQLQTDIRECWEQKLTYEGFFQSFVGELQKKLKQ